MMLKEAAGDRGELAPLQRVEHNLVLDTREAKQKVVSPREALLAADWPNPALRRAKPWKTSAAGSGASPADAGPGCFWGGGGGKGQKRKGRNKNGKREIKRANTP